jgi:hypothetical protein
VPLARNRTSRRRIPRGRGGRGGIAATLVALVLAVCWALATHVAAPVGEPVPDPVETPPVAGPVEAPPVGEPGPTAASAALAELESIPVKGRAPKTGYDREGQFGTPWLDVDRNGCDTRNDILARDLTAPTLVGTCRVSAGTLTDPYTGQTIPFLRGEATSALVQIDHVVALSNAWQSGAQQLSHDQRVQLANDPRNLLAVDGSANQSKGDRDAATWLPANTGFRCDYVERQVTVKHAYGLWVTAAERDAMLRVLSGCP